MRAFGRLALLGLLSLGPFGLTAPVAAQDVGVPQSELLVIDPERLFEETELGQRMAADHQAAREELAARNRKLEAELEAEEQRLTDIRAETSPEAFREMADAFDARVQDIRRDSERRVRDLERDRERMPLIFLRTVEPVILEVMREAGGVTILDARAVLFRAEEIDITNAAAARIDEVIGAGEDVLPSDLPPERAPEAVPEPLTETPVPAPGSASPDTGTSTGTGD
ncbi:MAG: OmpH family outer membrane protein [Roseovarius sp.]